MGRQTTNVTSKNQTVLKIGVGGKWDKVSKKRNSKLSEQLQTIHEEEGQEDQIITEAEQTEITVNKCGKQETEEEDSVKNKVKNGGGVKILVTKRKEVLDEAEDQEVVIEALQNTQDLVEYWILSNMAIGVQDINEKNKILTDITRYNKWISEPKVTGSRVIRVELFITLATTLTLRELVDAQFDFIQREGLRLTVKCTGNEHTSRLGYLIGPVVD